MNLVGVEVENRSGAEVDEPAAVELAQRVLAAEGIDDGELGLAFAGAGGDPRVEAATTSGSTRPRTSSRSRSTGGRSSPPGFRARSATS